VRSWYRSNVGGLPGTYWYLWTGMLINRIGGFGVLFLSLYLVKSRGLDASGAGVIVGLAGVGGAAGSLTGGVLADRWGRRKTLLLCHAATGMTMFALAFVTVLPAIAVITFLMGFCQAMAGPAMVAAIVDIVPEHDRQRAFNLQFWAFNLGVAAASLLAGVLAETGFTLLFVLDGLATFLTLAVLALKVPETMPDRARNKSTTGGLRTPLTDRTYMTFVGLTLLMAIAFTQSSTILPLAMESDGLRPSAYGFVTAFAGALIVIGQLFVPKLIGRRSPSLVLATSNVFLAVGFGLVAGIDTVPLYLVAAFIWTSGSMLAAPPNAEIIAGLSPEAMRARYQAVFYLVFPLAGFLAPALGGFSLQHLGSRHWIIVAALCVLAAAGQALTGPARERRIAELREAELIKSVPGDVRG
jgi:predicted MFS family arabinose efflux permease